MNIRISLGSLLVRNSTFTDGKVSHVSAEKTDVTFDGVTIENSEDLTAKGHALNCYRCLDVKVTNSTFRNLRCL